MRDKVTGKKWIYLKRNTPHRLWAVSEGNRPWKLGVVSFLWTGSFHRLSGRISPTISRKEQGLAGIAPQPTF